MRTLIIILLSITYFPLLVQAQTEEFQSEIDSKAKPWTHLNFRNDPDHFQFAIVSDNTGGATPGVFAKAMEKINLLQPEFVMSVGDLINGGSSDTTLLLDEWDHINGLTNSLEMPFFYAAGNHDIFNPVMGHLWDLQFGKRYYHFKYKEVLFLVLFSNETAHGKHLSQDQVNYAIEALQDNQDVRWTMVFLHHPLWEYQHDTNFDQIEEELEARKYTVFAGHTHRYEHHHHEKHEANYYVLARTGARYNTMDPSFGIFTHITWVTMRPEGPRIANVEVNSILPGDVVTRETRELADQLLKAAELKNVYLEQQENNKIKSAYCKIWIDNPTHLPMEFDARFFHHHSLQPKLTELKQTIKPGDTYSQEIPVSVLGDHPIDSHPPLELQYQLAYPTAPIDNEFAVSGTILLQKEHNEQLEFSGLSKFTDSRVVEIKAPGDLEVRYTTDGSTPDFSSAIYQESLEITDDIVIKARMVAGNILGKEHTREFRKVKFHKAARKAPEQGEALLYQYYPGNYREWKTEVPDLDQLNASREGTLHQFDQLSEISGRENYDSYAIRLSGYLKVSADAVYEFRISPRYSAEVYLHEQLVAEKNFGQPEKNGEIALKKGWHLIQMDLVQFRNDPHISLYYRREGAKQWQKVDFTQLAY